VNVDQTQNLVLIGFGFALLLTVFYFGRRR
jgi:LPXTG-motif cell wall-anchored protein